MDRQLFILDDQVWDSMSFDDVENTMNDMKTLGIDKPPCRNFDVLTKMSVVNRIFEQFVGRKPSGNNHTQHFEMKWRYSFNKDLTESPCHLLACFNNDGIWHDFLFNVTNKNDLDEMTKWGDGCGLWVLAYLIVALSAKNSAKTVKENKLMKLGIGKKKEGKYRYTTTVTIGRITETEGTGEGGGWTVRPHLRRGHIREQRYGPNRQYSKKVFIQPIFVNAVEGFVDQRKAYNVRIAS